MGQPCILFKTTLPASKMNFTLDEFRPSLTSTWNHHMQLSELFSTSEPSISPDQSAQSENIDESVIFVKSVPPIDIITIEDSFVIQSNSTITIDESVTYVISLDTTEMMEQDSKLSLNSSHTSSNLTNSLENSYSSLFIPSCPVHSHHHEMMDLSIYPNDPPCECLYEIE